MLYLLTHGGLFSVNHINVLFHFTLCDASFSESRETAEFSLKGISYCVYPVIVKASQSPSDLWATLLLPQGCPQALNSLPFKYLSVSFGFYPQLETSWARVQLLLAIFNP